MRSLYGSCKERLVLGFSLLAFQLYSQPASAQFNPEGRRKKPAASSRAAPKPSRAQPEPAQAKAPSQEALIARYRGIVLNQPAAQFPLQRLSELYRERDGNLDKLVAEFEALAGKPGAGQLHAKLALAGIYRENNNSEKAISVYETALEQSPNHPVALLGLARLLKDQGRLQAAKERFAQALEHTTDDAQKEQLYRTLLGLSLDLKDYDAARSYHKSLVQRAKGSFFVEAELGRELMQRGEYELARDEYSRVVKAMGGDNRVLAPALRDLGRAEAKLGNAEAALKTLRRALRLAGAQAGVRQDILKTMVEVYRSQNRLTELVDELERSGRRQPSELRLLGGLYEETGQVEKALEVYRAALRAKPRDIETRLRVVQLLQLQGELELSIKEYEALIRAAPRNPDFVFQLAEALIQRGRRDQALRHLKKLEGRSRNDEQTLVALVDFYERIDEKERALAVLQRLGQTNPNDPRHLVELGHRYWEQGQKEKAQATWKRIELKAGDRAQSLYELGEVYLEHDLSDKALEALKKAIKLRPNSPRYKRAYALALERIAGGAEGRDAKLRRYDEAGRMWEQLLKDKRDEHVAREARQHLVTLWGLAGGLSARVSPLRRKFNANPPDLDSGRLLAEVQLRLRNYPSSVRTLRRVIQFAPGDKGSLLRLEQALVKAKKLVNAIEVLKKLAKADPPRAREYYQRMAKYAAELYRDDEALRYAVKAVELSPDDAMGHLRLAEMYRKRQDTEHAISALRRALSKNDRLFLAHFQLAELLLAKGEVEQADQLLRRVLRASPDEELVTRATRVSMQINLGKGTLQSLEQELLPLALGNPQKPLYRRLLVEVYGAITFPLVHAAGSDDKVRAQEALATLRKVGERAVKPLLDALGDEQESQQRIAIELLEHIHNKGAGAALFAYATSNAPTNLRVRAMLALSALKDPGLLDKLSGVLLKDGRVVVSDADPFGLAAAWAVARMRAPKARGLLVKLAESDSPNIAGLGILGLAWSGDHSQRSRLADIMTSFERGPIPRSCAVLAVAELGLKSEADKVVQLADAKYGLLRATAVLSLARLHAVDAPRAIAQAFFSTDPQVRRAAVAASLTYVSSHFENPSDAAMIHQDRVDLSHYLSEYSIQGYTAADQLSALENFAEQLAQSAASVALSSPQRARIVAKTLVGPDRRPFFGPLMSELDGLSAADQKRARRSANTIAASLVRPFAALSRHPLVDVRSLAIQFLATRYEPPAVSALTEALRAPDSETQRVALAAVARFKTTEAVDVVIEVLKSTDEWPLRVRATESLAALIPQLEGNRKQQAWRALEYTARHDPYTLVREAAKDSMAKIHGTSASKVPAANRLR